MGAYTLENLRYTGFEYITAPRFVNVMWAITGQWFQENRDRFLMFLGVVLVGILCFEAGMLHGKATQTKPLILSVPALEERAALSDTPDPSTDQKNQVGLPGVESIVTKITESSKCAFVGSKNSNKYHAPQCATAKRIKPENKVCFSSKEEAERRGYVASCLE